MSLDGDTDKGYFYLPILFYTVNVCWILWWLVVLGKCVATKHTQEELACITIQFIQNRFVELRGQFV